MEMKKHRISEIFNSMQGEGEYTGIPTAWVRFFGCNLDCKGFGQKDPTDESTYILPYQEFDETTVNSLEELPVWKYGCDSSYSWAKKFAHLQMSLTAEEIVKKVRSEMANKFNPDGLFEHPYSGQQSHLCFTGGEPLLKGSQGAIVEILKSFVDDKDWPRFVTIETNGTRELTEDFARDMRSFQYYCGLELFFSVSPKLFTVSGEKNEKAIKPEVVASYARLSPRGQLKFVMGSNLDQWKELEDTIQKFRNLGVDWPVWIMPVGATEEGQHGEYGSHADAGQVANMAISRGYNVSPRVHVYLFGNIIGV